MIDDLKPYPEYKDSGLPWLGRIPKHWECLPHRAIFEEVKEQGHVDEQLLSVTIGKGIIRQEELLADSSKKDSSNLDKSKYKLVEPGDIAYNKMRAWQGAVGVSKYRGIISPAYIVQRLRGEIRPEYFHYLFRTPGFAKEAERWSYGITSDQWSLRPQHFKMIYSCVQPYDEQDAIVRFLRSFDGTVRRFIRNRRRLIEVLNEQKQAIINRFLTRGVDSQVTLKSSGVEWLGEIPDRWEPLKLKYCITPIEQGWSPQCDAQPAKKGEWGVLKVGCVNGDQFDVKKNKRLPNNLKPKLHLLLRAGDILVSRANTTDLVGLAALVEQDYPNILLCDKLFRFKINHDRAYAKYLVYLIRCNASRAQIESRTNGASSSMQNIGQGVIKNLWVSLPSKDEQKEILKKIEDNTSLLSQNIHRAKREIEIVREYRTRLISDVVTGEVDVRHLAPAPGSEDMEEEINEIEPLDESASEMGEEALAEEVSNADR